MAAPLLRVGLTGGIATGKSFCLRRFTELGAPTLDADLVARAVVAPGTPCFEAIVRRFGREVVGADGALDRPALARIVFADSRSRRDLEAIVHPAVYDETVRWFSEQRDAGARIAVADIPLLYETNRLDRVDRIVVAFCPAALQKARLIARNGLSPEDAQRRIDAQLPIDEKRRRADYVISTAGSFDDTRREVDRVWRALQEERGSSALGG
jgi:dephospho-CoA kinase